MSTPNNNDGELPTELITKEQRVVLVESRLSLGRRWSTSGTKG